jgi:hypothetical protein
LATQLHYYGSVFDLSENNDDDMWRRIVSSYLDEARDSSTTVAVWFDLSGGGHVSLRLNADTPLAIVTR